MKVAEDGENYVTATRRPDGSYTVIRHSVAEDGVSIEHIEEQLDLATGDGEWWSTDE